MAHQNRKNPHQDGDSTVSGMVPPVNTSLNETYWLQLRIFTMSAPGQLHRNFTCLESQENYTFMKMRRRNRSIKQVALSCSAAYTRGPSRVTHREPPGVCICNSSPRDWGAFPQLRNVLRPHRMHTQHSDPINETFPTHSCRHPGTPWRLLTV